MIQRIHDSGEVAKTYRYDAFGNEETPEPLDANPFRYCCEYFDAETATLYLRARSYDARNGRFTQEDSAKDGGNWYVYCGGNPVGMVDPSGCYYTQENISSAWEKQFHDRAAFWMNSHLGNEDRDDPDGDYELMYNTAIDVIADALLRGDFTEPSQVTNEYIDAYFSDALEMRVQTAELLTTTLMALGMAAIAKGASGLSKAKRYSNLHPEDKPVWVRTEKISMKSGKYIDERGWTMKGMHEYVVMPDGSTVIGRAGHVSLAKGKDVLYAGELYFSNGKLTKWNNFSGHYQPSATDYKNFIKSLNQAGIRDVTAKNFVPAKW